jgi:hypothetical protein
MATKKVLFEHEPWLKDTKEAISFSIVECISIGLSGKAYCTVGYNKHGDRPEDVVVASTKAFKSRYSMATATRLLVEYCKEHGVVVLEIKLLFRG